MNAFYKIDGDYQYITSNTKKKEIVGVVVGADEGEMMNKIVRHYGRDNINQITFWFSEFYEDDVVEIEDFYGCPLFDFEQEL